MRIVYVAKHNSGGNDDEGAITHALTELGHNVQRVREENGRRAPMVENPEMVLFHKFDDVDTLRWFRGRCPVVFWYFDLVDSHCTSLTARDQARKAWMGHVLPVVDFGFCTDGDWVAEGCRREFGERLAGKLHWLMQGADERIVGRGTPRCPTCRHDSGQYIDILFTGIREGGGTHRVSWVDEMRNRWGDRFVHVARGVHREELRDLIAASKVVVAPDFPITNRYWSNRVYNALGFGAFLIHPRTIGLMESTERACCAMYDSREDLHRLIKDYLGEHADKREAVSKVGLEEVKSRHLYRHRCEQLLKVVQG